MILKEADEKKGSCPLNRKPPQKSPHKKHGSVRSLSIVQWPFQTVTAGQREWKESQLSFHILLPFLRPPSIPPPIKPILFSPLLQLWRFSLILVLFCPEMIHVNSQKCPFTSAGFTHNGTLWWLVCPLLGGRLLLRCTWGGRGWPKGQDRPSGCGTRGVGTCEDPATARHRGPAFEAASNPTKTKELLCYQHNRKRAIVVARGPLIADRGILTPSPLSSPSHARSNTEAIRLQ